MIDRQMSGVAFHGQLHRVNIGCGRSPTVGWLNFDASPSVLLADVPGSQWLAPLAHKLGLLDAHQSAYLQFCRGHEIRFANALQRIPLASHSCSVVYASHVLEHLSHADEVPRFLAEVRRLLTKGGIVRLAVPDLGRFVQRYHEDGDADGFVKCLHCVRPTRLRGVRGLLNGLSEDRSLHRWIYDRHSLTVVLLEAGFHSVRVLSAGETTIADPGALDLYERSWESLYVEAVS